MWPLLKTTPKVSEAKIPSADEEALQTQRTHRPLSYNEICDEVLKEVFLRKRSAPPSRSSKPVEELIQSDVQPASLNSVIPTMNEPRETPVSISIGETPTTHKERQSSSDTLSQYPLTRSYTSSQATRQPESAIEILDPDDGPKFSQIVEIPEIQEELSSPVWLGWLELTSSLLPRCPTFSNHTFTEVLPRFLSVHATFLRSRRRQTRLSMMNKDIGGSLPLKLFSTRRRPH